MTSGREIAELILQFQNWSVKGIHMGKHEPDCVVSCQCRDRRRVGYGRDQMELGREYKLGNTSQIDVIDASRQMPR